MRDTTANTMTLQDKRKGQMLMQLQALDQELSSDRQTDRQLVSNLLSTALR